jgi:aminoglycoside phosphotransferase (APT) family kinase protein
VLHSLSVSQSVLCKSLPAAAVAAVRLTELASSPRLAAPLQLCLCEDPAVLGTPFYVMEHVRGRIFTDPSLPGMPPQQRAAAYQVRRCRLAVGDVWCASLLLLLEWLLALILV